MADNTYYLKYLKYKKKYLKLSKKLNNGGATLPNNTTNVTFKIRRPYNKEDTLILGCGNGPNLDKSYRLKHLHKEEYTIDVEEIMNPSCLTDMSYGTFCEIPDKSIKNIICEGFTMDITKSEKFISEINRIKTDDANIECEFKNIGTFRNFNGTWANIYNENPFIRFSEVKDFVIGDRKNFELDNGGYMIIYIKDIDGLLYTVDFNTFR